MEPITEIAAAEKGAVDPVECRQRGLGCHGIDGIGGMVVDHAGDHLAFVVVSGSIQSDEILFLCGQPLEQIHAVGEINGLIRRFACLPPEIPTGPGPGGGRQHRHIGMEDRTVGLVPPGTEKPLFFR